jgi:hypothetical protein
MEYKKSPLILNKVNVLKGTELRVERLITIDEPGNGQKRFEILKLLATTYPTAPQQIEIINPSKTATFSMFRLLE